MKKWTVDGEVFAEVRELTDYIESCVSFDQYEEIINETSEDIEICGITFRAGYALRQLDFTSFKCGMGDYIDGVLSDYDFEEMEEYDTEEVFGLKIECIEDEA